MDIKSRAKALCSTFIVKELGGIESGRRDLSMTVLGTIRARIIVDKKAYCNYNITTGKNNTKMIKGYVL